MTNLFVSNVFVQALLLYSVNAQYAEPTAYDLSNNPLLPTECGPEDLSDRIFGGKSTQIDEFPWMALLEYRTPEGIVTNCGGALISKRYVLTAAHCLKSPKVPTSIRLTNVRLGEHDTSTDPDCSRDGQMCADRHITVRVTEQIMHENYQANKMVSKHDIALLRLQRNVRFTDYVKPICLPPDGSVPSTLDAAGWGLTENNTASNVKLKVSLPYVEKDQCKFNIGAGQICAGGETGRDTCTGDSGGPLMALVRTEDDTRKWFAIGVTSYGPSPCGKPGWPGVYTKVSDFVPWILSKMRP